MYELQNLPCSALQRADALCRISVWLHLYRFWLVWQRRQCQPPSCRSDCDCARLIMYQGLSCEMNAGQTRGGSVLRLLCSEWLSWTVYQLFFLLHLFLIPLSPLRLFWIPFTISASLELFCLPFLSSRHLPAFTLLFLRPFFLPFFSLILSGCHVRLWCRLFCQKAVEIAVAKSTDTGAAAKDLNEPLTPTRSRSTTGLIFSRSLPLIFRMTMCEYQTAIWLGYLRCGTLWANYYQSQQFQDGASDFNLEQHGKLLPLITCWRLL